MKKMQKKYRFKHFNIFLSAEETEVIRWVEDFFPLTIFFRVFSIFSIFFQNFWRKKFFASLFQWAKRPNLGRIWVNIGQKGPFVKFPPKNQSCNIVWLQFDFEFLVKKRKCNLFNHFFSSFFNFSSCGGRRVCFCPQMVKD